MRLGSEREDGQRAEQQGETIEFGISAATMQAAGVDMNSFRVKMRRLLPGLATLALFAACSKAPEAEPAENATPAPHAPSTPFGQDPPAPPVPAATPVQPPPSTPAADSNLHVLAPPPPNPNALPDNPPELEALYFVEGTPPARRIEIVRALGRVDTTESAAVLGRIFDHDKRMEARLEVVQAAADFQSPASHAGKLAILTRAIAPTQPQIMRLNTLQALADFDDPSVPALLKSLTADSSSAIREAATNALATRKP